MKKIGIFFIFWLGMAVGSAQNVTNVDFLQVGDEIIITYDLALKSDVRVFLLTNEGRSFQELKSISGDARKVVSPGKKRVVWSVLHDCPKGLDEPVQFKVFGQTSTETINGVEFELVYVCGGSFQMVDRKNFQRVLLSDYYIGKFEVTQGLWKAVMGNNPSHFKKGDNYPVENVTWDAAQTFLTKLNQLTGKKYALPTEAQWEYAARGGVNCENYKYSGSNNIDEVAWYNNSGDKRRGTTHLVGKKQPNELGIYDMSGNVAEYCSDWYDDYSNTKTLIDPIGPATGHYRVVRGGSWDSDAWECLVFSRTVSMLGDRYEGTGLRLVLLP